MNINITSFIRIKRNIHEKMCIILITFVFSWQRRVVSSLPRFKQGRDVVHGDNGNQFGILARGGISQVACGSRTSFVVITSRAAATEEACLDGDHVQLARRKTTEEHVLAPKFPSPAVSRDHTRIVNVYKSYEKMKAPPLHQLKVNDNNKEKNKSPSPRVTNE